MMPSDLRKMLIGKKRALSYDEDWKKIELRTLRWIGTLIHNSKVKPAARKTPERLLPFFFDKKLTRKTNARNSK